jgi:hypothetical protein
MQHLHQVKVRLAFARSHQIGQEMKKKSWKGPIHISTGFSLSEVDTQQALDYREFASLWG